MKIIKSRLKQIIQEEIQKLNEAKFTKLGYHRDTEPRGLGPVQRRGGGRDPAPEKGQEIAIWHDGNWHDTVLTDEELEEVHSAFDPDYESYSDVVQRVLSSLRDLDIEDVEL